MSRYLDRYPPHPRCGVGYEIERCSWARAIRCRPPFLSLCTNSSDRFPGLKCRRCANVVPQVMRPSTSNLLFQEMQTSRLVFARFGPSTLLEPDSRTLQTGDIPPKICGKCLLETAKRRDVNMQHVRCGKRIRCPQPTWSNHLCYLAMCADLCQDAQLRQVPWMHAGTNQTRLMTTRWVHSSRYLSTSRRAHPGNTWPRPCLEKPEAKNVFSLDCPKYS